MMTDPIADFLTRIRNGNLARKERVDIPWSKMKERIANALVADGELRFVLLDQGGLGGRGPGGGQSTLTSHITDVCTPVDAVSSSLYDCTA